MSIINKLRKNSTIRETEVLTDSKFFSAKDMIQTPVPMINVALSGSLDGGLTPGLTVFAGPSKHFKTAFAMLLAKSFMEKYPDAAILFYDSEFGAPAGYFKSFGIDTDRVIHTPITDIEQLKHDIMSQINNLERDEHVIIIVDSIGNLASRKEVEDALEGKTFKARVIADKKPLDKNIAEFNISPECKKWKAGKLIDTLAMKKGDTFYLTWCMKEKQKVVMQIVDEASLEEIKTRQLALINSRLAKDGLEGYIDTVDGKKVLFTVYATYWSQANQLKPGQLVQIFSPSEKGKAPQSIVLKVVSQKNRGTYGSGFNEVMLETTKDSDSIILSKFENIQGTHLVPLLKAE